MVSLSKSHGLVDYIQNTQCVVTGFDVFQPYGTDNIIKPQCSKLQKHTASQIGTNRLPISFRQILLRNPILRFLIKGIERHKEEPLQRLHQEIDDV